LLDIVYVDVFLRSQSGICGDDIKMEEIWVSGWCGRKMAKINNDGARVILLNPNMMMIPKIQIRNPRNKYFE